MASSDTVGYEILKLLGVDTKHAYSADIRLVAGEPLEVSVTYRLVSHNRYDPVAIRTNMENYVLMARLPERKPTSIGKGE
jgi:hypothetical protein